VVPRVHRLAGAAWAALAAGASLGFLARDLLGLPQPWIAVGWSAGAALGLWLCSPARPRPRLPWKRE